MKPSALDALLLLMAIIWGSNYSIVKSALDEVPPLAFNAARLAVASTLFLLLVALRRGGVSSHRPVLTSPRLWLVALVGYTAYQPLFIIGLSHTSAANSALIIGCTPIFVALMSAALGAERIGARRWAGVALSAAGIYLVVGHGTRLGIDSLAGDLMMLAAVFCWSLATILSRPLLADRDALTVTGYSMAIGTIVYLPFAWRAIGEVRWTHVSSAAWLALAFSACLALVVSYTIWFTAVQRLGNTRTAVYSNMVPVAGMIVASLGFGEPIGWAKAIGAAAILVGVAIARL